MYSYKTILFIACLILVIQVPANQRDFVEPVFHGVSFSQTKVDFTQNSGDTIIDVAANFSDADSGMWKAYFHVYETTITYYASGDLEFNGTLWVGQFSVTSAWPMDNYTIMLLAYDNSYNQFVINTPAIEVINPAYPDTQPPMLNAFAINTTSAAPGDVIRFTADVTDANTISHVTVTLKFRIDPSLTSPAQVQFDMLFNNTSNNYYYDLPVHQNWPSTDLYVFGVYVEDIFSHSFFHPSATIIAMGVSDVLISGTTPDNSPPIFSDFRSQVRERSIAVNDSVHLEISISDDVSGVHDAMVVITYFENLFLEVKRLPLTYNLTSHYWEASFPTTVYWEGKYQVYQIQYTDNVGRFDSITTGDLGLPWFCVYDPWEDDDGDGMPTDWEACFGLDPFDPANAAFIDDADGLTPLEEFQLNSNPGFGDSDGDWLPDGWEFTYLSDYTSINRADSDNDGVNDRDEDADGDGLTNYEEYTLGTKPNDTDTDQDCMNDGFENLYVSTPGIFTDPLVWQASNADYDNDGLSLRLESEYMLNPILNDTDSDNIGDYDEVFVYQTDGAKNDTDSDLLYDYDELFTYFTSPTNNDSDGDGLDDYYEVNYSISYTLPNGTILTGYLDPWLADSDFDQLSDYDEIMLVGSFAFEPDSDWDNVTDFDEYSIYNTSPLLVDSDSDTLSDEFEIYVSHSDPNSADSDLDGLNDSMEVQVGTNLWEPDSDFDGLNDSIEVLVHNSNPWLRDSDYDGLDDLTEYNFGSSSNTNDSDNDLLPDIFEYTYSLDPNFNDSNNDDDNDSLSNLMEYYNGTHPGNADVDNDTLNDYYELLNGTDPWFWDYDLDNVSDGDELLIYSTDPKNADTDADKLTDGEEIFVYHTNATSVDSEYDLVWDYDEVKIYFTNPNSNDSDGDNLDDFAEINTYFTDPNSNDSDEDLLIDYDELFTYHSNPNNNDTDTDSLMDGDEIALGSDILDPDTDHDNLLDGEESRYGTSLLNNDTDSDSLLDGDEVHILGSDPTKEDTENDGMTDAWEAQYNLKIADNDASEDVDDDGLTNKEEYDLGTSPRAEDTDGDGFIDGREVDAGSDPLDPNSIPNAVNQLGSGIAANPWWLAGFIVSLLAAIFSWRRMLGVDV